MEDNLVVVDGFAWLNVTNKAKEVFNSELFTLFALNNDNSESEVECMEQLEEALSNHQLIVVEVGHIPV